MATLGTEESGCCGELAVIEYYREVGVLFGTCFFLEDETYYLFTSNHIYIKMNPQNRNFVESSLL